MPVAGQFEESEGACPERYEKVFGFFRPVIGDVIGRYLACGDLGRGLARARCPECGDEYLLHPPVTDGGFTSEGTFHVKPKVDSSGMEGLSRHRVLTMLLEKGKIRAERARMILSWAHA